MKQRLWSFPAIIIFVLSALVLNACSYSVQVLSTAPVPTQIGAQEVSIPATNTQLPATPTLIPPLPTPTLIPIRADTLSMLENFATFTMGDIVRSVVFTPDGTVLAAAGGNDSDYTIHLWDVVSGKSLGTLSQHTGIVWGIAFSPDGQLLASVSSDATAKIWDWRNGTLIKSLDFPGQVVSVSFSPDGQTLAVGGVEASQNASVWTFAVGSWKPALKLPNF